jgi:Uma2 family endonuclease
LGYLLRKYQHDHPQGKALDKTLPEHDVLCGENRRRADRVIWAGLGRRPRPAEDAPTIVVEFVSEGKRNWLRDYIVKRNEYLTAGVKEYWIIDRFQKTMTVFAPGGRWPKKQVIKARQKYVTPLLPGFELPLGTLFTLADDWEA